MSTKETLQIQIHKKKKVKEWENIYQYNVNSMQNSWSGYSYIK